jgi:hypothetical protein
LPLTITAAKGCAFFLDGLQFISRWKFFKEIAHDYRFEVAIVSAGKKQKKKGKEKKKK